MGHTQIEDQNNALYGHKTELTEQLREGELPVWFEKDKHALPSEWVDKPLPEIIDAAAERARERREDYKDSFGGDSFGDEPSEVTFTRSIQFPIKRSVAPDSVVEKMHVTREQARKRTGFHRINLREYRVAVDIGVRGGIEDLQVVRDVHH